MQTAAIKSRLDKLCETPCSYLGKKVTITTFTIDEVKAKVYIHIGTGLPEERKFDEMESFFKHCTPYIENKKSDVEILSEPGDNEEEEDLIIDILPAPEGEIAEDILSDDDLKEINTLRGIAGKELALSEKQNTYVKVGDQKKFTTPSDIKVTINDVKDILMDTIKKVQAKKDYVEQASAINQSVNSLINLAKLSILLMNQK